MRPSVRPAVANPYLRDVILVCGRHGEAALAEERAAAERPSTVAVTPSPACSWTPAGRGGTRPRACASATTARDTGCLDPNPHAAAPEQCPRPCAPRGSQVPPR